MGTFSVTLKTHSRTDITGQFQNLNLCVKHGCKPTVWHIVAGRRRENYYTANCIDDACGKIATDGPGVVAAWNKWNPE